jgi:hypothetical protein
MWLCNGLTFQFIMLTVSGVYHCSRFVSPDIILVFLSVSPGKRRGSTFVDQATSFHITLIIPDYPAVRRYVVVKR